MTMKLYDFPKRIAQIIILYQKKSKHQDGILLPLSGPQLIDRSTTKASYESLCPIRVVDYYKKFLLFTLK